MVRLKLRHRQGGNAFAERKFSKLWYTGCGKTARVHPRISSSGTSGYNVAVAFVIRDSRPEEFDTLWRIDQECFPPGIAYSRRELSVYMRRRESFTLVAANRSAHGIAGFIVACGGVTGHIITIDVVAAARRSGLGSQLLRSAEDRLHVSGSKAVHLETAVDNTAALLFYKRHGYAVIDTSPRYYSNGVDALVLKKELSTLPIARARS
jgi:[ribosomal protein S18]-alanine N-acetyltransferase